MPIGKKKPEKAAQQDNFFTTLNIETIAEEPKTRKPKHDVWHQHDRYIASLIKPIVARIVDGVPVHVEGRDD